MAVGRIFFQGGAVLAKFYFNHLNLTKQPLLLKTGKRQFARSKGAKVLPPTLVPGSIATRTMTIVTQHKKLLCNTTQVVEQHNKYCKQQLTNEVIVNQFWKSSNTAVIEHSLEKWLWRHYEQFLVVQCNQLRLMVLYKLSRTRFSLTRFPQIKTGP